MTKFHRNKVVFKFEIFQKLSLTCYDKAITRSLLFLGVFYWSPYSNQAHEKSGQRLSSSKRHFQNRRVPGSNPSKYWAGFWKLTSCITLSDLWAELKMTKMINIGWVRQSLQKWSKDHCGVAKLLAKNNT